MGPPIDFSIPDSCLLGTETIETMLAEAGISWQLASTLGNPRSSTPADESGQFLLCSTTQLTGTEILALWYV